MQPNKKYINKRKAKEESCMVWFFGLGLVEVSFWKCCLGLAGETKTETKKVLVSIAAHCGRSFAVAANKAVTLAAEGRTESEGKRGRADKASSRRASTQKTTYLGHGGGGPAAQTTLATNSQQTVGNNRVMLQFIIYYVTV